MGILGAVSAALFLVIPVFLNYRESGTWHSLVSCVLALAILLWTIKTVKGMTIKLLLPLVYFFLYYLMFLAGETPGTSYVPRAAANSWYVSAAVMLLIVFLNEKEAE